MRRVGPRARSWGKWQRGLSFSNEDGDVNMFSAISTERLSLLVVDALEDYIFRACVLQELML